MFSSLSLLSKGYKAHGNTVFNVNSNSKVNVAGASVESDELFKKSIGWTAGAGVDIFGVTIDFRYNGQFKDSEGEFVGAETAVKSQNWSVSVGYLF